MTGTTQRTVLALAALAALARPTLAQDDKDRPKLTQAARNLDVGLLEQAPRIVDFLAREGYRNVGVLPFQVKKGTRRADYLAAPLGTGLPGRLENALLLAMSDDEKTALRLFRDPAGFANRQRAGSWSRNKSAFDRLFATSYPVAWGEQRLRPDVFLTGVVSNTGNRLTTRVEIVGFSRNGWSDRGVKTFPVAAFDVVTDRALLRDLGHAFALPRSVLKRTITAARRDELALEQVEKEEAGEKLPRDDQTGRSPANVAGMGLTISYNGARQALRSLSGSQAGQRAPLFQLAPAPTGAQVVLVLTRLDDDDRTLGVIVKVNGQSTFQLDDRDSLQCRKWLYDRSDRGKPDRLTGFWMDRRGERILRFRLPPAGELASRPEELGERVGWIDVDVFASGEADQPEEQFLASTRGLSRGGPLRGPLRALQQQLLAINHLRHRKEKEVKKSAGGLVLAFPEPGPSQPLTSSKWPNPVRLGGISIRYGEGRTTGR